MLKEEKKAALLTVVIPVHNRPKLIVRTVESVVAQTYRPFNLIVVDNNSTDETSEVLSALAANLSREDLQITVLHEERAGATYARNCGLAAVQTQWTMFFDSDDYMAPNHIELAMKAAAENADADVVGWDVNFITLGSKVSCKPFELNDLAYDNLFHATFATQRYMAKTELFRVVGGWNTKVTLWDDIELGARLLALNPRIVKVASEPTVFVEAQEISISGRNFGERIDKYQAALDSIEQTLPAGNKHLTQLKKVIIGATIVREGCADGRRLYEEALAATPRRYHRVLWRVAYAYTRCGGRGIARIMRGIVRL